MNLQHIKNNSYALAIGHVLFITSIIGFTLWLCFAIFYQQPFGKYVLIIGAILFALYIAIYSRFFFFFIFVTCSLLWYFNIEPQQNRDWSPEVSKLLSVEQHNHQITLHNVRNFDWHSKNNFTEHWETRTYNLDEITGVNVITSYWMGPQIAHTLVSFNFAHQRPLVFSIEIRKERNESFSALGGFFRKFELNLVAADERDILYLRSNIRGEQVYFFPIQLSKPLAQELFLEYLTTAQELAHQPRWYNTLTSNCTTLIFDMAQRISQEPLPKDYRILVSGYLPNYLYDHHALNQQWTIKQWYQHAYVNPRTQQQNQTSKQYSENIRKGLP